MTVPTWADALMRYQAHRELVTRARMLPFSVQTVGPALVITPRSGLQRRITKAQFERSLPLIDRLGRASLLKVSFNSSYIESIVDDLRRG